MFKQYQFIIMPINYLDGLASSLIKYYSIKPENIDPNTRFLLALILEAPPNLLRSLASLFTNNIVRYLTFSQLVEETETVDLLVTPRTFTF